MKRQYGLNQIAFYDFFCHTPVLENQVQIASFKGPYGSSVNDTVHSVQMDNLIHQDNTG